MPGPIDALHFVHEAILNEARSLEADLAADPPDAAALRQRLATLTRLLHGHTHGEELGLFPKLDARFPHFGDTYVQPQDREDPAGRARRAARPRGPGEGCRAGGKHDPGVFAS